MKSKKWIALLGITICVVGCSVYVWNGIGGEINARKSVMENTIPVKDDDIVVYSDGEYTATVSKEEYATLSETAKANLDNTYQKIIEKNPKVVDDETAKANYEQTGNVTDIVNNISCVSIEVLDKIFVDYIAETNDIGMVVVAKDFLSEGAIDKIVKKYVSTTEDVGVLEVLNEYVSETMLKELKE